MILNYEVLIIEGSASVDDIRIHSDIEFFYNRNQAFLEDKFGNICEVSLDTNDNITGLLSYGWYPRYILYRLVTTFNLNAAFLFEDDYYRSDQDWESRSEEDTNSILINYKHYNWENYFRENGLDTRYPYPILQKNHEPTDRRIFLDDTCVPDEFDYYDN